MIHLVKFVTFSFEIYLKMLSKNDPYRPNVLPNHNIIFTVNYVWSKTRPSSSHQDKNEYDLYLLSLHYFKHLPLLLKYWLKLCYICSTYLIGIIIVEKPCEQVKCNHLPSVAETWSAYLSLVFLLLIWQLLT